MITLTALFFEPLALEVIVEFAHSSVVVRFDPREVQNFLAGQVANFRGEHRVDDRGADARVMPFSVALAQLYQCWNMCFDLCQNFNIQCPFPLYNLVMWLLLFMLVDC